MTTTTQTTDVPTVPQLARTVLRLLAREWLNGWASGDHGIPKADALTALLERVYLEGWKAGNGEVRR